MHLMAGTILTLVLVAPAAAMPVALPSNLESIAPENLRCSGKAGPRDGFHFEAQWQLQASFAEGSFGFRPQR
jgi:hypothetical protein